MVQAVAPKPLNVLVMDPAMPLAELAGLGVRRVSVGGSLARVGWAATVAAAKRDQGWIVRNSHRRYARQRAKQNLWCVPGSGPVVK